LDGLLIDLSMKVSPWAVVAREKAALNLHPGLDHDGLLVFDRGYSRHAWHKKLTDKSLIWVTRARKGMHCEVAKNLPVANGGTVIRNRIIRVTNQPRRSAQTVADI
jgi:putative transposase